MSKKQKQTVKNLISAALLSATLTTGLSVNFQDHQLTFEQSASAQTACDKTIRSVSFPGRTSGSMTGKPNVNTNVRSNTATSASIVATIPPNTPLTFSGWAYGQGITDIWSGKTDYRWFRVTYGGKTGWVASGVIYGYPSNAPIAPTCSGSNTSFTMTDYYGRLYGHTTGATSSRGYISSHGGIDSTDQTAPYNVQALVGGKVVAVKTNGAVLQNVTASSDRGYHPGLKQWVKASNYSNYVVVHNPDLDRYFVYLHLATVNVRSGQWVNPRQVIGVEGSTGWSTGRHTHLGVRNASYVYENPLNTLTRARSQGVLDKRY